ncbi:MarR family transcriptional regulator [Stappia sp. F7233]|uniref:MarR family transcriptional regulator n=1 Tax=Stappia albiluteola TaxID=2758565 RepID=A0A839ADD9_9HYPH|nr:MarR family transcriptional regulator [Stappia albiluteola]MBA5776659.1 MarR family transcriptional regulator [Stappia albiluteola]
MADIPIFGEGEVDAETRANGAAGHKDELRLWLRLLTCTNLIEAEIRSRLRSRFDVTLPRFDLMAQLERAPDGMTLGELSKRMMVSAGNVTGLVDRLLQDGLLERRRAPGDRRSSLVRLTAAGHDSFRAMAEAHGDWIGDFFAGLGDDDVDALMALLGRTKASVRGAIEGQAGIAGEGETDNV